MKFKHMLELVCLFFLLASGIIQTIE